MSRALIIQCGHLYRPFSLYSGVIMKLFTSPFVAVLIIIMLGIVSEEAKAGPQYDLVRAVETQDIEKLISLLQTGVSPDTRKQSTGEPAILIAATKGDLQIVKLLLENGANANYAHRRRGVTALMQRSIVGDTIMIKLLLAHGADPNRADISQETPLLKAVKNRKLRAVKILLAAGADPNVQDLTGKTALEYAKLSRSRRFVKMLQDAGATY
ncbi:MAG: hypothetical protein COB37_06365 [Kordiimonadales bacterium]|nr:MAG: hypothetical protein COB37_06365 [Kordiimonadales bacterium]